MSGQVRRAAFLLGMSRRSEARIDLWRLPGLRIVRGSRLAVLLPSLIVGFIVLCSVFPGLVAPRTPTDMDSYAILKAPGGAHVLGTDQFGRDMLSLLVYGARQSLTLAVSAVALAGLLGASIGLASGYGSARMDFCLMRLIDIWMAVPPMLLALILAAALHGGFGSTILAVGLMIVPAYARVMRAQVIAVRGRPFVRASRAIGASRRWILVRHVLPHTLSPILVLAATGVGDVILVGAALSFIGLGVVDDRPDWGFLMSQGRNYVTVAWWYATFPGLAITSLVISANLLGDALRDRLDPRRQQR